MLDNLGVSQEANMPQTPRAVKTFPSVKSCDTWDREASESHMDSRKPCVAPLHLMGSQISRLKTPKCKTSSLAVQDTTTHWSQLTLEQEEQLRK